MVWPTITGSLLRLAGITSSAPGKAAAGAAIAH